MALGATLLAVLVTATQARAADNPIVIENRLPGNPASEWDVAGSGDASIQGFTDDISYNRGQTAVFRIKTDAAAYHLDIYRVGYYGGAGARKVAAGIAGIARTQPACKREEATGLVDCGNWLKSASWPIPSTATSGIYFARLVRADTGGASHVFFVVRNDGSKSAVLVQTSDTTWQAYNAYGGNSLYVGDPDGRAYKVSYNRPFVWRTGTAYAGLSNFFHAEYPMVRWLEANGYDVTYFSGVDTDRRGQLIKKHKLFISMGHDEYWSAQQRSSVEAALAAGVNLAFFSGNEVFWKTRWENSIDGRNKARRTLVCYKETHENRRSDPLDPPTWTGTWRDPRFSPPADGGRPENGLTGQLFTVNGVQFNDLKVGAPFRKMRLWRNTSLATMSDTDPPVTLGKSLLGFEWDEDVDNRARPRGLVRLSSSTWNVGGKLLDFGSSFAPGTATHSLTLYRHPSGARVFGAGTIQWSWGLDETHDNKAGAPVGDADPRIQQATVNLFADMGVQPQTLRSNLRPATALSDTRAPTSRITSPTDGGTVERGATLMIAGTATDAGGGVIGGVEVSVDGGNTWHPAVGRENWSFAWTPTGLGARTIRVAAVDDSGNLEQPDTSISVNVVAGAGPTRIWAETITPDIITASDSNAIELGVKFASDVGGSVTGIYFYKGSQNTGVHLGHLWQGNGTLLATAEFEDETASGWQHAIFASPVPINANTTYVASYYTEAGHYSFDSQYFSNAGFDNEPLHALRNGVDGPNGVYVYGRSSFPLFPSSSYQASNYWVDVDFLPSSGEPKGTTIWANTAVPEIASVADPQPIEVGIRFQSDVDGRITALRFFKGSANTGPHVGNLWSGDGKLLASAPFKTETPVGWQQVELQPPVPVKAGIPYVASYHTQSGRYAASIDDRPVPAVESPPLFAQQGGEAGSGGLYRYGASGFPTRRRPAINYWVDVIFEPEQADVAGATGKASVPDYAPRRRSVLVYPVGVEKKKTPQTADPLVPADRSFLNGGHPISPTGR
ncbi:MAG: DUF6605 domain-containing protein [Rhodospirillales bacterium]